jgi:Glycosyl hydrolase family 76
MTARLALKLHAFIAPFTLALATFFLVLSWQHPGALARVPSTRQQIALNSNDIVETVPSLARSKNDTGNGLPNTLDALLDAIDVMQEKYFDVNTGTWPESIDWTAAVLGTHVSATLSTIISSIESSTCTETLGWDNLINRYFSHTSIFYFGENALSLRQQAYDDMLWVVLGWLENIKLMDLYSSMRSKKPQASAYPLQQQSWHGTQFKPAAAHRARLFYDLASHGWDTSLCSGGMVWNPHLRPYKNSITNELFISASISMYLYFPGDSNDSPFLTTSTTSYTQSDGNKTAGPIHNPQHLQNAVEAYTWLNTSNMTNPINNGLYADGFHISGWHRNASDGLIDPGTGKCDDLNTMVYTYNQGVVLTGLRGLWLATAEKSYLEDGHVLVGRVMAATNWPDKDGVEWKGLGRGGVLEEYCDSRGYCSQNGQTFKGIFFHHLAEFCRRLSGVEEDIVYNLHTDPEGQHAHGQDADFDKQTWEHHLYRCERYRDWVEHNAHAAAATRDEEGRFGMWWGRSYPDDGTEEASSSIQQPVLPPGAVDYANSLAGGADYGYIPPPRSRSGESRNSAGASVGAGEGGRDVNDRSRGRTVETQSGGVAVLRALWQWEGGPEVKRGEKKKQQQQGMGLDFDLAWVNES